MFTIKCHHAFMVPHTEENKWITLYFSTDVPSNNLYEEDMILNIKQHRSFIDNILKNMGLIYIVDVKHVRYFFSNPEDATLKKLQS